jgi:hypothetical protein
MTSVSFQSEAGPATYTGETPLSCREHWMVPSLASWNSCNPQDPVGERDLDDNALATNSRAVGPLNILAHKPKPKYRSKRSANAKSARQAKQVHKRSLPPVKTNPKDFAPAFSIQPSFYSCHNSSWAPSCLSQKCFYGRRFEFLVPFVVRYAHCRL